MNTEHLKNSRISNLSKGKIKGLGFVEKICLKIAGYIDGKRGLPRNDQSGNWVSPYLDREVRSYDEFASRMWGQLQIEEESSYAALGKLMDSLLHTKALLSDARADLAAAYEHEKATDAVRKHGESKLTEAQVVSRRANEKAKRLAIHKNRVSALQSKLDSEVDEFSKLRNKIIEDNNSTRMIVTRVRDHLYQRLDCYWNAALSKHPDNTQMPTIPCVDAASRAECVYMEHHKLLMQKADLLCQSLADDKKEVA